MPAGDLQEKVTALASDIAKVPLEILRMKKISINRVTEIQGFRSAMSMAAGTDALLHFTPTVAGLHDLIKERV